MLSYKINNKKQTWLNILAFVFCVMKSILVVFRVNSYHIEQVTVQTNRLCSFFFMKVSKNSTSSYCCCNFLVCENLLFSQIRVSPVRYASKEFSVLRDYQGTGV